MEAEPSRSETTEINSILPTLPALPALPTLFEDTSPPLLTEHARSTLHIEKFLREFKTSLLCHSEVTDFQDVALLKEHVEYMIVAEAGSDTSDIQILENVDLDIHVYQLNEDDVVEEYQEEENVLTANYWDLPARALDDIAFIDRADIKQYIGLPSQQAIYGILSSCIRELMRVRIIAEEGMSGRTLRKMPFLAYAHFLNSWATTTLKDFLKALEHAVDNETLGRKLTLENQGEDGTYALKYNKL
ncbi:10596_t:CDS:2 [Racocetra fulgida]|uniref:10596_t:CDS:1 n=1 Tax=Racocetra fulgida TaxID=60492 RepID=A0A9N9FTY2_9GLOM|nr:10596_t:CDS:2 [Racocetra fulgida]